MRREMRGATLVEFSLAIVIVLMAVFGLIEVSRYALVKSLLIKGAQQGLNFAQKVDALQNDIRLCEDTSCADYRAMLDARNQVAEIATTIPLQVLDHSDNVNSFARLATFTQSYDLKNGSVSSPTMVSNVLVLRPGEIARNDSNQILRHPSLCPKNDTGCPISSTKIKDDDSWRQILDKYDYEVHVGAHIKPILGFAVNFGDIYVEAVARGLRETPKTTRIPPKMGLPIPPNIPVPTVPPTPTNPPCPGGTLSCGGSCIPACGGGMVLSTDCQCVPACAPPSYPCPTASGLCVTDCPANKVWNDGCSTCGCSSDPCPGDKPRLADCSCPDVPTCTKTCGDGELDNSSCFCDCSSASCASGFIPDANCNCVQCDPPNVNCNGQCLPPPGDCEYYNASCQMALDCSLCSSSKIMCPNPPAHCGDDISSLCSSTPGFEPSNGGCNCSCGNVGGTCGTCGVIQGGESSCDCSCNLDCGPMGTPLSNSSMASPQCECDCSGDCGFGVTASSGGGCGPCQCQGCGSVDCGFGVTGTGGGADPCQCSCSGTCGVGTLTGGGGSKCSCDTSGANCGASGTVAGGGDNEALCRCLDFMCGAGSQVTPGDGMNACECSCDESMCNGGTVSGGGSDVCSCDCGAVTCPNPSQVPSPYNCFCGCAYTTCPSDGSGNMYEINPDTCLCEPNGECELGLYRCIINENDYGCVEPFYYVSGLCANAHSGG